MLGLLCVLRRGNQQRPLPPHGDASIRCAVPGSCRRVYALRARSAVARTCRRRERPVFGRRSRGGGNGGQAASARIGTAAQFVGCLLEAVSWRPRTAALRLRGVRVGSVQLPVRIVPVGEPSPLAPISVQPRGYYVDRPVQRVEHLRRHPAPGHAVGRRSATEWVRDGEQEKNGADLAHPPHRLPAITILPHDRLSARISWRSARHPTR